MSILWINEYICCHLTLINQWTIFETTTLANQAESLSINEAIDSMSSSASGDHTKLAIYLGVLLLLHSKTPLQPQPFQDHD